MRSITLIVLQLLFWSQYAAANYISPEASAETFANDLDELRIIAEDWTHTKRHVIKAWDDIKTLNRNTNKKSELWAEDVKKRTDEATTKFKSNLDGVMKRVEEITKRAGTGDIKKCLSKEMAEFQKILMNIVKDVITCVTGNTKKLSLLTDPKSQMKLDDTKFIDSLDSKLNKCVKDGNDVENCINESKNEIWNEIELAEDKVLTHRSTSRIVANNIMNNALLCTVKGLTKASKSIVSELLKIIICIRN